MRFATLSTIVGLIALPTLTLAQSAAPPAPAPPAAGAERGPQDPEARARFEKVRAVCSADFEKHCSTVERTGTKESRSAMRQCIDTHKSKFSPLCQTAVTERETARDARKQAQPATGDKPKS